MKWQKTKQGVEYSKFESLEEALSVFGEKEVLRLVNKTHREERQRLKKMKDNGGRMEVLQKGWRRADAETMKRICEITGIKKEVFEDGKSKTCRSQSTFWSWNSFMALLSGCQN